MTASLHTSSALVTWTCILAVAALAVTGEVLTAAAMHQIGDFDETRARSGMKGAIFAVIFNPIFVLGSGAMTLNFFVMLYALSVADVSLVAPATASLTYIGNAVAAKLFLHENVDRRRWIAASFVILGVILLAK
jgi:drug/metabolite transporter (DMT)-like permease